MGANVAEPSIRKAVTAQFRQAITQSALGTYVFIQAEFAREFQKIDPDGRFHFVQNPNQKSIYHITNPDGSTEVWDGRKFKDGQLIDGVRHFAKRVKGVKRGRQKGKREADATSKSAAIVRPAGPPEICLCDIHRVELITGFKKSFIYERSDFPIPITWGSSKRAASRWVEAEVIQWVKDAMQSRLPKLDIGNLHCQDPQFSGQKQPKTSRKKLKEVVQFSGDQFAVPQ
jgi:predicted DNA-binding transcriptional regulator AlpA